MPVSSEDGRGESRADQVSANVGPRGVTQPMPVTTTRRNWVEKGRAAILAGGGRYMIDGRNCGIIS